MASKNPLEDLVLKGLAAAFLIGGGVEVVAVAGSNQVDIWSAGTDKALSTVATGKQTPAQIEVFNARVGRDENERNRNGLIGGGLIVGGFAVEVIRRSTSNSSDPHDRRVGRKVI